MNFTYFKYARLLFVLLLSNAAHTAHAQALAEPQTVSGITDVAQFGMRPDAQFVACNGLECPQRTPKHFAMTSPALDRPVISAPLAHRATPVRHVHRPPVRHRKKRSSQSLCR